MLTIFYIFSAITITAGILPFLRHPHWIFRVWEFGRVQLLILQIMTLLLGILFLDNKSVIFWTVILVHLGLVINHIIILIPYTTIYKSNARRNIDNINSDPVSIISVNVYQFNDDYSRLLNLVKEIKPDIILTMESNAAWDKGLSSLEEHYPNFKKVPLENTYGIHFYTRLKTEKIQINYFTADDLPSIEATLQTDEGNKFTFFGVHPPPPSPTEEDTAKERDAELLAVAKKVKEVNTPTIVAGDFNNVAWARSSILFRKTSELIDPRIGRGFVSTYHAKYRLLRFPIDLFFHSTDIFIKDFKTLKNIGSDHLPLFCSFIINKNDTIQKEEIEKLEEEEKEVVDEIIEEGIEEESDRPAVASE